MEYRVLPGFLRRREQRLFGLITPLQLMAGLGSLLPTFIAAQASLLLMLPMLGLAGVLFYSMAPAEGSVHALLWLYRLRALAAQVVDVSDAFETEPRAVESVPIVLFDEDGGVALAAEVDAAELVKARFPRKSAHLQEAAARAADDTEAFLKRFSQTLLEWVERARQWVTRKRPAAVTFLKR